MAIDEAARDALIEPAPLAWPSALDAVPAGRCKFTVAPPRHFLYPAILLLLAEDERHGYALVDALAELGLGRTDRPGVYRALGDLEADGLIASRQEPSPNTGTMRHVHVITEQGEDVLESWMSVVAQERTSLDLVLKRYWNCNVRRFPDLLGERARPAAEEEPGADREIGGQRTRFDVVRRGSSLVVEARSNIGPIAFSTSAVSGRVEVALRDGLVQEVPSPIGVLEVAVGGLSSGNSLYDGELVRRVDARRHPTVQIELKSLSRLGEGNCYQVVGEVTLHGVARQLLGIVTATVKHRKLPGNVEEERLLITGEYVLDVRHFDMEVPKMPILKIYPDVRLHLRLEAVAA